jgi:hypothetical protein
MRENHNKVDRFGLSPLRNCSKRPDAIVVPILKPCYAEVLGKQDKAMGGLITVCGAPKRWHCAS